MPRKIEISHKTIVFTVVFLGSLWFLYFIRDIILQVFLALLVMTILNPLVTKLEKLKIPRAASVLIVYVLVFFLIGAFLFQMTPLLIDQSASLGNSLTKYLEDLSIPGPITEQITQEVTSQLGALPGQALKIGVSIFSNFIAVLTVLFFTLYFLIAREKLDEHLVVLLKKDKARQQRIEKTIDVLESKMGGWARGQLILMFIVGLTNYIGFLVLGVPFALPLAVIAGLFELIPNVGPIIAAIPAIVVGFGVSPLTALAVAALAFLIQQIEIYLLVPKVMEKSAGVSPIITLLSLVIGLKVAGVVGAILSVPVVITTQVILQEFYYTKGS